MPASEKQNFFFNKAPPSSPHLSLLPKPIIRVLRSHRRRSSWSPLHCPATLLHNHNPPNPSEICPRLVLLLPPYFLVHSRDPRHGRRTSYVGGGSNDGEAPHFGLLSVEATMAGGGKAGLFFLKIRQGGACGAALRASQRRGTRGVSWLPWGLPGSGSCWGRGSHQASDPCHTPSCHAEGNHPKTYQRRHARRRECRIAVSVGLILTRFLLPVFLLRNFPSNLRGCLA
jgi:hypothetical protein